MVGLVVFDAERSCRVRLDRQTAPHDSTRLVALERLAELSAPPMTRPGRGIARRPGRSGRPSRPSGSASRRPARRGRSGRRSSCATPPSWPGSTRSDAASVGRGIASGTSPGSSGASTCRLLRPIDDGSTVDGHDHGRRGPQGHRPAPDRVPVGVRDARRRLVDVDWAMTTTSGVPTRVPEVFGLAFGMAPESVLTPIRVRLVPPTDSPAGVAGPDPPADGRPPSRARPDGSREQRRLPRLGGGGRGRRRGARRRPAPPLAARVPWRGRSDVPDPDLGLADRRWLGVSHRRRRHRRAVRGRDARHRRSRTPTATTGGPADRTLRPAGRR